MNDLLRQISDPILRDQLAKQIANLSKNKKFGLVFEEHIPERTPLFGMPLNVGAVVAKKSGAVNDVYVVIKIDGSDVLCENRQTHQSATLPYDELVAVTQFGDPIFPSLEPIARVENAPDDSLWHTVIEADNYHALQLLEYLYNGKVDCIYIDPPYNTGARDWKYNNDYVDSADSWRHSKWLSMIKKRLIIAKRILANDGVLITTIDDNEYAHLWILLNEIFPEFSHTCVTIQHNPGGTQGKKFSVTNEFAIYSYSQRSDIFRKPHSGNDVYNLRRWGSTSGRYEGATCFYPIYVDTNLEVIGFGNVLEDDSHPSSQLEDNKNGTFSIWPIDINGIEKKWRYSRNSVDSVKDRLYVEKHGDRLEVIIHRESEPPKTVWTDNLFNAEAYGTDILKCIVGNSAFQFPKSVYAVRESLLFAVKGKKNSLIIDFFAGSGTTLHAVNLLNAEDGGNRRCVLVTNNEVSEAEAKQMNETGLQPGDPEWESRGICRSVTWPRTEYSILGRRADGTTLTGEYFTNLTTTREMDRRYYQLGFVANPGALSTAAKKQIVALLGKNVLPQMLIKAGTRYVVSEKHTASVLFDPDAADEWLSVLEDQEHITDLYIVTDNVQQFTCIKDRVSKQLGTFTVSEPLKRPMSQGFPANSEYFKLGFLDKESVSMGLRFSELLPVLWLKAGAVGKRPELKADETPEMLILPQNAFAVLLDEDFYGEFALKMESVKDSVDTVFFATHSEEAFREMSEGIGIKQAFQLYRDYTEHFVHASRRNS